MPVGTGWAGLASWIETHALWAAETGSEPALSSSPTGRAAEIAKEPPREVHLVVAAGRKLLQLSPGTVAYMMITGGADSTLISVLPERVSLMEL